MRSSTSSGGGASPCSGRLPLAEPVRIRSLGHDWEVALDALATMMPVAGARVDSTLRKPSATLSRSREIVVVTGRADVAVEPLLELRRGGRTVSLVAVASETFAGRPRAAAAPALLRASVQGIPVAVVSADVPIEASLAGRLTGPSVRRRVLAAVVPVAAVAFAWASLETDPSERVFLVLGAAALLPALPRLVLFRLAAAAAVLIVLVSALAGTTWGAIRDVTDRGFRDFYAVVLPFDGRPHPEMHVLVVLAAALFCVAIALTADGRPFVAAATVAAGVGWPATILPARNTIAMGALGLFAALWPLVVARSRDRREILPGHGSPGSRRGRRRDRGLRRRPPVDRGARLGELGSLRRQSRAGQTVALVWTLELQRDRFPGEARRPSSVSRRHDGRSYWRATTA